MRPFLASAVWMLVLGCASAPEREKPDPVKLFREAEETLLRAKTLRIRIWAHYSGDSHGDSHGILLVDRDARTVRFQMQGNDRDLWLSSDGKRMTGIYFRETSWPKRDAPGDLDVLLTKTLLRAGVFEGLEDLPERLLTGRELRPLALSEFSFVRFERMNDRDYAVISTRCDGRRLRLLWIDLETHLPLKIQMGIGDELIFHVDELFSDIALDGPMPAVNFDVPR